MLKHRLLHCSPLHTQRSIPESGPPGALLPTCRARVGRLSVLRPEWQRGLLRHPGRNGRNMGRLDQQEEEEEVRRENAWCEDI